MSDNIQLKMEPSGGDTAKLDARDFVQQFDALLHAVREVGLAIDAEKSENITYRIERLTTNSPATAEITPELAFAAEPVNVRIWHEALWEGINAIREGAKDIHAAITAKCVLWLKKMAAPIGEHVHRSLISIGGREFVADAQFKRNLQKLDASDRVERMGAVKGMVERMNIHKDTRQFHLYPFVGPESVVCKFLSKHKERATSCFGKYVRVHGDLHYHWREKWPFEITVSEIEILPVAEALPKFSKFWGIAPDATGAKTAERFIEDLRNG